MLRRRLNQVVSLLKFRRFERQIHPDTRRHHDRIVAWAESLAASYSEPALETLPPGPARRGLELAAAAKRAFARKRAGWSETLRLLVHVPPVERSPGGHSLFANLMEACQFIGIPAEPLRWGEPIVPRLKEFRPSVLLTSDAATYLGQIDWDSLRDYRRTATLKVGLTASLAEYGNSPLPERLRWARAHCVDFYYSFKAREYVAARPEYRAFAEAGYPILHVEFGANPLIYVPVPGISRDLDYVFLASGNADKRKRYYQYLGSIFRRHPGLIDGPGWSGIRRCAPRPLHRFLYARARVGINLHIDNSIDWPSELNERTYILAACGVPQLVDRARLLEHRFSSDALFVADTPADYERLFAAALADPEEADRRAAMAQAEVFARHTSFHRADALAQALLESFFLPTR